MRPPDAQWEQTVGVLPSADWISQCAAAANHQEDRMVEQLLCHDLRDVVDAAPSDAMRMLQAAASTDSTSQLPESFRLLVQVENFSDMAVNAEKRLEGPSAHSTTHRCLKLAFTDGRETYTAMEMIRIPGLTISPGVKVLLRGSMTIRNGICGWTPANAIVLGGCVQELVDYYQQTLQKERQRVGHGVDPTVKALIWMNHQENGEEEQNGQDESDRASGDVADAPTRGPPINHPTVSQRNNPLPLPPPPQPTPHVTRPLAQQLPQVTSPGVQHNHAVSYQQGASNRHPPANVSLRNQQQHPVGQQNPPSYQQLPSQPASNITPRYTPPPQQPQNNNAVHRNPYQQNANHQPPATMVQSVQTPVVPMHPKQPTSAPQNSHFPIPQSISPRVANPYQRSATSPHHPSQASTDSSLSSDTVAHPYQQQQQRTSVVPMEFLQLREMLQRSLQQDSNSLQDALFAVSIRQVGVKLNFNIERRKHGSAKAEMRKLSKSDKARSAELIRDGGKAVMQQMLQISKYTVTMPGTKERGSVVDGAVPILHILRAM